MAKIVRKTAKVFGSSAGPTDIGQFGSLAAGAPTYSNDPDVIQALTNYAQGWLSAIVGNSNPAIEDMNALFFLQSRQIAYLMQTGVSEWDANTTYYIGSIANNGSGVLYKSIVDNNTNNVLTDVTKWALATGAGGGYTTSVVTSNTSMTSNTMYLVNTTSSAITMTLPSGTSGAQVFVFDDKGTSSANNITIAPAAGQTIAGGSINAPITISNNRTGYLLAWDGATWATIAMGAAFANSSGLTLSRKTASFTAAPGFLYELDTTSAAITVTLPSFGVGGYLKIVDGARNFGTNNCIITPQGGEAIKGLSTGTPKLLTVTGSGIEMYADTSGGYWAYNETGQVPGNYQPASANLTGIAAVSTIGWAVRTAANTWTTRGFTGTSGKVTITNPNGTAGNADFDVSESSLNLAAMGGTLQIAQGGTGQTTGLAAFTALSPQTTKGDLIVDNGTNPIRLAAGLNGQVPTYDSSAPGGLSAQYPPSGLTPTPVSSNVTAANNQALLVDSTAAARTITAPTGAAGVQFSVVDDKGTAATNNITINGTFVGGLTSITINTNHGWVWFLWNGSAYTYMVAATGGGGSGLTPVLQTASFTAAVNSINMVDHTAGGIIVGTLPSTSLAAVVTFVYAKGVIDTSANFFRAAPSPTGGTDSIDGNAIGDTEDFKSTLYAVTYSKAAGSNVWYGQYQRISTVAGGSVPGSPTGTITAGSIGENINGRQPVATSFPASNSYTDAITMPLTAGLWSITGIADFNANGATVSSVILGISTTAGNSSSGLIDGDTSANGSGPTATYNTGLTLPSTIFSISTPTTFYLKVRGTYTGGTPTYKARMNAVRIG